MSLPFTRRAVAAAFGATAVWRALSGVAAVVRWLWLGEVLGNGSMALLLVSVVVGPIVGAVAGDAALREGYWSPARAAHRRRIAALLGLLIIPFVATQAASLLLGGATSLPLYGAVTLTVTALILLAAFSGRDEREDGDGGANRQHGDGGADGEEAGESAQRDRHHREERAEAETERHEGDNAADGVGECGGTGRTGH